MSAHILIVEDDPLQSAVYSELLELYGYSCEIAESFSGAMSRLVDAPPDAIMLDVVLGDGSGARFFNEARDVPAWANVPVVVCTGVLDPTSVWDRLTDGAEHVVILPKPFYFDELRTAIRSALRLRDDQQWLQARARGDATPAANCTANRHQPPAASSM